jgi:hypothetical protein
VATPRKDKPNPTPWGDERKGRGVNTADSRTKKYARFFQVSNKVNLFARDVVYLDVGRRSICL